MASIHPTAIVEPGALLDASVSIGAYSIVRAGVSIASGTTVGPHCVIEGRTRIGHDNRIFQFCSIGAPPQDKKHAGEPTTLANNATLAGHVHVGDCVTVGGLSGVHQFVKIGAHAFVGFSSAVTQDVPPYMMVDGNPLAVRGFNVEGLRRRGFGPERIAAVKQMHRLLYRSGLTFEKAQDAIHALAHESPAAQGDVALMTAFLAGSARGIAR